MVRKRRAPRRSSGFTLVEIVVVSAIALIVGALAIPSLHNMLIDMDMARLDSAAKQIYLVGQNRLVSMRESGTLARLMDNHAFGSVSLSESGGSTMQYSVGSTDDATAAELTEILPDGAIDYRLADGGHYLVVFLEGNKGLVREVYYSETPFPAWDAATLEQWRSDPAKRRNGRIGFFDGGVVDMGAVKRLDPPILDVENGEQLELQITLPSTVPDPVQVEASIKITDLSDSSNVVSWTLAFPGGFDEVRVVGGKQVYIKVLDKLFDAGKRFADICPGITPGADIQIEASLLPAGGPSSGVSYLPSLSAYQRTNSLFAGLGTDARLLNGKVYTGLQFQIASGRHLQNLDLLQPVAGAEKLAQVVANMDLLDDGAANKSVANYFSAVQTGNIDWGASYPGRSFLPINRAGEMSYYGLAFYEGNNYKIRGLEIRQGSQPDLLRWGLFAFLSNTQIRNSGTTDADRNGLWSTKGEVRGVRLADLTVEARTGFQVGGLGGWVNNINVTDCHIYVEDTARIGDYRVVCTGSSSMTQQAVGGLIGAVSGAYITDSSVSMGEVIGGALMGTGGLVGYVQDYSSIIDRCYVNVEQVKNTGRKVAGMGLLAGNVTNYVANSYAIGTLSGEADYIGGLVGGPGGGSGGMVQHVANCYVAVSFQDITTARPIQAVTHNVTNGAEELYYVLSPQSVLTPVPGRATQCGLDELAGYFAGLPGWRTGVAAVPYDASLGTVYPYPGLAGVSGGGMIHYGDWPQ